MERVSPSTLHVDTRGELKSAPHSDATSSPRTSPPGGLRLWSPRLRAPPGCDGFSHAPGISRSRGREEGGSALRTASPDRGSSAVLWSDWVMGSGQITEVRCLLATARQAVHRARLLALTLG